MVLFWRATLDEKTTSVWKGFLSSLLQRNPDFPDREDLMRYKAFTGIKQKKRERFQSEASLEKKAVVEDESFADTLTLCLYLSRIVVAMMCN